MEKCEICGKVMKVITHSHLRMHGMTTKDYLAQFPEAKVTWNHKLTKETDSRIKGTIKKGYKLGHPNYYSREYLGGKRFEEIEKVRAEKISKNSNKDGCRKGSSKGHETRRQKPNYGFSEKGLNSLRKAMAKTMKGRSPWNYHLTKYDHPSILIAAIEKTIHFEKDRYAKGWTGDLKQYIKDVYDNRCVECGSEYQLVVHHDDFGKDDHSFENLYPLCRKCHAKLHGLVQNNLAKKSREDLEMKLFK